MKHCVVLGGGISGIAAAHYLSKCVTHSSLKITLIEGSKRLGGWVESTRTSDGAVFDHGPRSLRGVGKVGFNSLKLFEDLGLSSEILPVCRNHPAASRRYVYAKGELCVLPSSIGGLIKRTQPFSKSLLSQGWKEPFREKVNMSDDSVYNFISRRFSEEIAHYLIDPVCRGIFAGDARKLSIKACFKPVFTWEQEHGSVIRGAVFGKKEKVERPKSELIDRFKSERWAIWSLKNGLQQLVDSLEKELSSNTNVEILKGTPCDSLEFARDKVKVKCGNNVIEADHVISSVLGSTLGSLLEEEHSSLADNLKSIPSVHCGVVHLEYKGNVFPELAFGHLVPSTEPSKVLGFIYQSSIFPQHCKDGEETTRLICMLGGAWFEELFGNVDTCDSSVIEEEAVKAAREQLRIRDEPIRTMTRVHKNCIPQYLVGHTDRVEHMESYISSNQLPLSLIGASYKGVSVNDCIYNAKVAAEKLSQALS